MSGAEKSPKRSSIQSVEREFGESSKVKTTPFWPLGNVHSKEENKCRKKEEQNELL
jgi:hypothetical protein